MAERKRYFLSFDRDNPRQREAEALYLKQAARQRSDFVVTCILSSNQAEHLERCVRKAIRDEIRKLRLTPTDAQEEPDGAVQLSDLPSSLINALDEL